MLASDTTSIFTTLGQNGVLQLSVIFAGLLLALAIWQITAVWRRVKQSEQRAQMVHSMLQRGFTPEQISRVLIATQVAAEAAETSSEAAEDASSDPEVRIVKILTNSSYEGDDVEKILAAARVEGRLDESTLGIIKTLAESWADTDSIVRVLESRRARGPRLAEPRGA